MRIVQMCEKGLGSSFSFIKKHFRRKLNYAQAVDGCSWGTEEFLVCWDMAISKLVEGQGLEPDGFLLLSWSSGCAWLLAGPLPPSVPSSSCHTFPDRAVSVPPLWEVSRVTSCDRIWQVSILCNFMLSGAVRRVGILVQPHFPSKIPSSSWLLQAVLTILCQL